MESFVTNTDFKVVFSNNGTQLILDGDTTCTIPQRVRNHHIYKTNIVNNNDATNSNVVSPTSNNDATRETNTTDKRKAKSLNLGHKQLGH